MLGRLVAVVDVVTRRDDVLARRVAVTRGAGSPVTATSLVALPSATGLPGARRSTLPSDRRVTVQRAALAALLAGLAGFWGGACGGGGSSPALPDCAADLPLPEAVAVVEITATPGPGNPTCAVTLASTEAVDDVVASWRSALDAAGIGHAAQQQPGQQALLRLEGPVCGSILVFAAGTARVTDAVDADHTPVLASITACPAG